MKKLEKEENEAQMEATHRSKGDWTGLTVHSGHFSVCVCCFVTCDTLMDREG